MPGTAVDTVFEGALQLAKKPGVTLAELAEALAGADTIASPAPLPAVPFPAVSKPLALTPDDKTAMRRLPSIFGSVEPLGRRRLSEEELKQITEEREAVDRVLKLLEKRKESISTVISHHLDIVAEEAGTVVPKAKTGPGGKVIIEASPRNSKGNYLQARPQQPATVPVPETGKAWSQEYVSGKLSYDDGTRLAEAEKAGQISRATYLAVTRETRVFDPTRAQDLVRTNPAEALKALRIAVTRGTPSSSLYLRDAK